MFERTEEQLSGCQDRLDWGQEGTRSRDSKLLGEYFFTLYYSSCILDTPIDWEYQREALVFNIKKACHPRDFLPCS